MVVSGALWFVSRPPAEPVATDDGTRYLIVAYEKTDGKVSKIKSIIKTAGYQFTVSRAKKHESRKIGYKAVQYFSKKAMAQGFVGFLKNRGIPAHLVKSDEMNGFELILGGNFKNRQSARNMADRGEKVLNRTVKFLVKENYRKFPYTTNKIVVRNITGSEEAGNLVDSISPITSDVNMREQETAPAKE